MVWNNSNSLNGLKTNLLNWISFYAFVVVVVEKVGPASGLIWYQCRICLQNVLLIIYRWFIFTIFLRSKEYSKKQGLWQVIRAICLHKMFSEICNFLKISLMNMKICIFMCKGPFSNTKYNINIVPSTLGRPSG